MVINFIKSLSNYTYCCQLLDLLVGRAERSESNFLRKLCKQRVCKHRTVPEELVYTVPVDR